MATAGIDDKSYSRGHSYVSVLKDLEGSRVLEVAEGRVTQSVDCLWLALGAGATVKAVAMDMCEPFMKSTRENVPGALVVHDRLHIAAYLGKAVDQMRRAEHKELLGAGETKVTRGAGSSGSSMWRTSPTHAG